MRRFSAVVLMSLTVALPAWSQTPSGPIGEAAVAPAMERLGVRLAANPELVKFMEEMQSAGVEDPFAMIGSADLTTMPDAVLGQIPGLIHAALRGSDPAACQMLLSGGAGLGEQAFFALLSASDSVTAEGWLTMVESVLIAYVRGEHGSPPPSPARVQSLMITAVAQMPEAERTALLAAPDVDAATASAQQCANTRSLFGAIATLKIAEAAELMRGLMIMGSTAQE